MPTGSRRSTRGSGRRPQVNFQVDASMKMLYDEAKASGHWVTRFCAAGFLMLIEKPKLRREALNRLRDWEDEYSGASDTKIRNFVAAAEATLETAIIRGMKPPPRSRKAKA